MRTKNFRRIAAATALSALALTGAACAGDDTDVVDDAPSVVEEETSEPVVNDTETETVEETETDMVEETETESTTDDMSSETESSTEG